MWKGPDPHQPAFPKSEEEMQIVPSAWLMGWGFLAKGDFGKGTQGGLGDLDAEGAVHGGQGSGVWERI